VSQLGASVSVVRFPGGVNALLIGAPNAADSTGLNVGTGRAYLVYTTLSNGANLSTLVSTAASTGINLDAPTVGTIRLNVVTITTSSSTFISSGTSQIGRSVAGVGDASTGARVGDANGDNIPDILIGAPGASFPAVTSKVGAVGGAFLISGANLTNPQTRTLLLQNLGQSQNPLFTDNGVTFVGAAAADRAGFSVASAGIVTTNSTIPGQAFGSVLIGAPGSTLPGTGKSGTAYWINGATNLFSTAITQLTPAGTTTIIPRFNFVDLATQIGVAAPTATPVVISGATYTGLPAGSTTGWAVAPAGDFNGDGFADFLIGSPGFATNEGEATLIYGGTTGSAQITGAVSLATPPTFSYTLTGVNPGDLAGFALTQVGDINSDRINEIAIGAPGFNNGGATTDGAAYLIFGSSVTTGTATPPVPALSGTASVGALAGTIIFTITTTGGIDPEFFGASLSSRLTQIGQTTTADGDAFGDLIIGAPGYSVNNTSNPTALRLAGGVFIVEGGLIRSLAPPPSPPPPIPPTPPPPPLAAVTGALSSVPATNTLLPPQFGPDRYVPPVSALSQYGSYQPIPLGVAYNQYLPAKGFRARIKQFFSPTKHEHQFGSKYEDNGRGVSTLGRAVFTRGKFKPGKTITFTHPDHVIPTTRQHETYIPTPNLKLIKKRATN
jgi:hypothetical protein